MPIAKSIITSLLTLEAKAALRRHNPRIVAVTGNVGKTSTKDAIYAVIHTAFSTRKSDKSFNSEIGLPLAILGLDNAWSSPVGWLRNLWKGMIIALGGDFPEWLVLEVGADHPGDIEKVSTWLHPDIVVLTRMSATPVHGEYFKGPADMLAEKMHLAKALKPDGTLVINSDDLYFTQATKDMDVKKAFYGEGKEAGTRIAESEAIYDKSPLALPIGQYVVLGRTDATGKASKSPKIALPGVVGKHLVYSVAAAVAVAYELGIEGHIEGAFRDFQTPKGRMRILPGRSSSIIIDDSYNSSPLAAIEALKAFGELSVKGKKIAVLADMGELGAVSESAHREVGALAGATVHTLVAVGEKAKGIAEGARSAGLASERIVWFADSVAAAAFLTDFVRAGDAVLVKGSQSMRMERVARALLAEGNDPADFLVRQEKEWLTR